ncbi:MAG: putative DNA binding domain-containing protein [Planctomycetes bacterium]|nr:putative DNA binding domain-containing protein [Planctomycetota bacterium]MCC7170688.1 putative DNA binding domain-containing protein [Planctomycetota bacterium]
MSPYTDQELEALLRDVESDRVERKESLGGDAPTKVREAICAFANDLPDHRRSGVVFIGATDDGRPVGLPITDELLRLLADMKTDGNTLPPPTLAVEKRKLMNLDVAVVTVEPADAPPVRFKGRIHIRVGPRRAIATAQDERVLNEKRRHRDRPFDTRAVSVATISDLDRRRFEDEYLVSAVAADVLAANERTYEQRLAATKMVVSADEPTPTVLGVLVLSSRTRDFLPGAYVQFLRIAGRDFADDVVDEQTIDGAVADLLRRVEEKLMAHNQTSVSFAESVVERRRSTYPMAALQQIVRNAVMHRSYEITNSPIRITWFDDRIEILSPGGPYGVVTESNFGQPGIADYRNPSLAEALKVLGFVQKYGAGIATARRALAENGNPIFEVEITQSHVNFTLRARS